MASISGTEKDVVLHPRLHAPLIILAVIVLIVAALSLGVVAFVVITEHPEYSPAVVVESSTLASKVSMTHRATTTTVQKASSTPTVRTTTTLDAVGSATTFIEYTGDPPTTTTLPEVADDESCNTTDGSYHGPFKSCGAKNVAWFDSWT